MSPHDYRALVVPHLRLPFAPPGGSLQPPLRHDAPGFVPPGLDEAQGGDRRPRRRRTAIPPLVANCLLLLAVIAFLADVVAILVPHASGIATASLVAVLVVASAATAAGLVAPAGGGSRRGPDIAAAGCVALLACLDLLSRAFRQEGSALLAAATLSACMALVASMLATVAAMER